MSRASHASEDDLGSGVRFTYSTDELSEQAAVVRGVAGLIPKILVLLVPQRVVPEVGPSDFDSFWNACIGLPAADSGPNYGTVLYKEYSNIISVLNKDVTAHISGYLPNFGLQRRLKSLITILNNAIKGPLKSPLGCFGA